MYLTIEDVAKALDALKNIKRPYGDNADYPINSKPILQGLTDENRENDIKLIEEAEEAIRLYVNVNGLNRAAKYLNDRGYPSDLNSDNDNIVFGQITIPKADENDDENEEWVLELEQYDPDAPIDENNGEDEF